MDNRDNVSLHDDLRYDYALGVDMSPDSDIHKNLLADLMRKVNSSHDVMSNKYESWDKIERNLTAYIPQTEEERAVKAVDARRPVAVVIPVSFAVREALLTGLTQQFLSDIYFPYTPTKPSGVISSILMREIVQQHCLRTMSDLGFMQQWSDGLTYGIGVGMPVWHQTFGYEPADQQMLVNPLTGELMDTQSPEPIEVLQWEGTKFENIHPRCYFPDPNVPAHKAVTDGEFIGILSFDNYYSLLQREELGDEGLMNVRYIPATNSTSAFTPDSKEGDRDSITMFSPEKDSATTFVLYVFAHIIPSHYGLSDSNRVEKWLFAIANDTVIIKAHALKGRYPHFPVSVCVPDYNSSVAPTSRMELIYGAVESVDFFMNVRFANLRKCVNNMFLVDEHSIHMPDMLSPTAGKIIRTKRRLLGDQKLSNFVEQLRVDDVTGGIIRDVNFIMDIIYRVSGATNSWQGVQDNNAPERRTAQEFASTHNQLIARANKLNMIVQAMTHRPNGLMYATNVVEHLDEEFWVKMSGENINLLSREYPLERSGEFVKVKPTDLDPAFDLEALSWTNADAQNPNMQIKLLELALANPALSMRLDLMGIYAGIARRFGDRTIQTKILPDMQVANMAADGQLTRAEEL